MTFEEFEEKFAGSFTIGEREFLWWNENFQKALNTFDDGTIAGFQQIERIGLALLKQNEDRPRL